MQLDRSGRTIDTHSLASSTQVPPGFILFTQRDMLPLTALAKSPPGHLHTTIPWRGWAGEAAHNEEAIF